MPVGVIVLRAKETTACEKPVALQSGSACVCDAVPAARRIH